MKKYVTNLASVYDGFRLDNAHSTPINVGRYLSAHSRKVNPNLIIIAELFTNTAINDAKYCLIWGINALIRESIYWHSPEKADQEICER